MANVIQISTPIKPSLNSKTGVVTPANMNPNTLLHKTNSTEAPVMPGGPAGAKFWNILDSKGMLPAHMQLSANTQGLAALRDQVTGSGGMSPWSKMQLEQLQGPQSAWALSNAAGDLSRQSLGRNLSGNSALNAWRNMASNAQGLQGVQQNLNDQRLNIINNSRAQQVANLQQQVGREVAALAPQEFNINNALAEKARGDYSRQSQWAEQMKAWAAANQSNATASSGKK